MQNYVDGPSERFITSSEDGLDVIDQEKWRKGLYRVLSRPMYKASSARKKSEERGSRANGNY